MKQYKIRRKDNAKLNFKNFQINAQIVQLESKIQSTAGTTISTILNSFPEMVRLELRLNDLSKMIAQVINSKFAEP